MTDSATQQSSETMRAVVCHRWGGPEVLTLERSWPKPAGRTFGLDELPEAHRYMEANKAEGKLVVLIRG